MTVTYFSCGRSGPPPVYCECGMTSTKSCVFELSGRKAGQTCGKPLCARCAIPSAAGDAPGYCGPHARVSAPPGVRS